MMSLLLLPVKIKAESESIVKIRLIRLLHHDAYLLTSLEDAAVLSLKFLRDRVLDARFAD